MDLRRGGARCRWGRSSRLMESRYDDDDTAHGKQADYLHMSTYGCRVKYGRMQSSGQAMTASWIVG